MGAAGDLGPHQRRLGAEDAGINTLQIVPAVVVVAVAGGGVEVHGGQPVFLHGLYHLGLIVLRHGVDVGELGHDLRQHRRAEIQHPLGNAHLGVQFIGGHILSPYWRFSGKVTPLHFISARMG